jgi:L-alanine-DL-glutamate epimerase-like enolase superfamily enzyme
MRIDDIRTTVVAVPQKRRYESSWRRKGHGHGAQVSVLVQVYTDEGLVGIGESPVVYAGSASATVALIEGVRELFLGADPLARNVLMGQMYAETGMAHFGTQGLSWATSGLDTALWDLAGKIMQQPLHVVWGGAWRESSNFYADIPPADPMEMAEMAAQWVGAGFRTLYFKVGFDPSLDIRRLEAVRSAVGSAPRIRVDANQAWSPGAAKRILKEMALSDLEYIEQPLIGSNLDDLATLRRSIEVPILAHESSLSVTGSLNVIKRGAADALQLDPRFDAGIDGARTAAQMAGIAGLPVVTHTFGELGVATAAILQLHAAHPNFILDNQTYYSNLEDDVIEGGLLPFDGPALQVPKGPGLGVALDMEKVSHYAEAYERNLHQERRENEVPTPYYAKSYLMYPRA